MTYQKRGVFDVYGAPTTDQVETYDKRKSQSSVQTSIFSQLGEWPNARGKVAWDCIHAAIGGQKGFEAQARLGELDDASLGKLLTVARSTRERSKNIYARTLADDVVAVLGTLLTARKMTIAVDTRPFLDAATDDQLKAIGDRVAELEAQGVCGEDATRAAADEAGFRVGGEK
jgi:hypothetical protein